MNGRSAHLELSYETIDITADLRPHLKGWTYTDNLSGQADDISITLEDREQLWLGDWLPDKGASVTAKIVRENWNGDGATDELPLGKFEIDEIDPSGPPSVIAIKAISVPESSSLRGEEKDRAWEKTHFSVIARDIAQGAGLGFFFDADYDREYDRLEQAGETDLAFLTRICNDDGLCLKVSDGQLVIFDEQKYEVADPITTIVRGESDVKSYSGRTTMTGIYYSCKVEYKLTSKKDKILYEFIPPNPPPTKRILIVRERVVSIKDAERLAKKKLRDANKEAVTFTITLVGDTRFVAGLTVALQGWGRFDGKYIITQAAHSQTSGYQTALQLRRTLEGY